MRNDRVSGSGRQRGAAFYEKALLGRAKIAKWLPKTPFAGIILSIRVLFGSY